MSSVETIMLAFGVVIFGAAVFACLHERHEWNGGLCRWCRSPWKYFATDSSGARGYVCSKHQEHGGPWISWGWDRNYMKRLEDERERLRRSLK